MEVMVGVKTKELTLVEAAELTAVGYRQSKRIWRRHLADRPPGGVSGAT
jgi:hypothetical protein